ALQSVDRAAQEDVLAAAEVRMEAGAELEQRPDRADDLEPPARQREDPCDQAQQRRLAGAVAADEADRRSRLDLEGHVLQRPDVVGPPRLRAQDRLPPRGVSARGA